MAQDSKQSFMRGAAILSVSTIIVKVFGLLFTFLIANMVPQGDRTYFYGAYDVFGIFMAVAATGLPVAVSRMVSNAHALGNKREAEKIFSVSAALFFVIGIIGASAMFVFAPQISEFMNAGNDMGKYAIMALAPTVFLYSLMAPIRGYFQGRSNMLPTAVSQTIEAVVKLIVGVALVVLIMNTLGRGELAVSGAIFGVTVSTAVAALYLYYCKRKQKKADKLEEIKEPSKFVSGKKEILISLTKIALPIALGAAFLNCLYVVDSAIVAIRLEEAARFTNEEMRIMKGFLGQATKLFDLPATLVVPFATTLLPVLTGAIARKDENSVTGISTISIRVALLISVPCALGMGLFAEPISRIIYPGDAANVANILMPMAAAIIFSSIVLTTSSILQAFGKVYLPVFTMLIAAVVRIVLDWVLTGNREINILGAPIALVVSYLINMVLNLIIIKKIVPNSTSFIKMFMPPLAASLAMGAVSYPIYHFLSMAMDMRIAVIIAILFAVFVYVVFAVLLKAIKKEEILMMPKGEKIAKVLRLK